MRPKLTIGLPYIEDFDGLYFTVQSLRTYHDLSEVELLIVDNTPEATESSETVEKITRDWFGHKNQGARYIAIRSPQGTAFTKNQIFANATGEIVLCMDSHVLLAPHAIERLIAWFADRPDCRDLIVGPMQQDNFVGLATHFADVWRGEMWGIWSQAWETRDEKRFCTGEREGRLVYYALEPGGRELSADELGLEAIPFALHERALEGRGCRMLGWDDADDFEVPGQGCGLFACRREAWLGFNPHFLGFGGEEMYLNEKYRQAGHITRCLGFLKWIHRFHRANGMPYHAWREDKVRNYVLGLQELGMPLDPLHASFVATGLISPPTWERIVTDPRKPLFHAADQRPKRNKREMHRPAAVPANANLFDQLHATPGDLNEHMPALRELASQVDRVTEFSHRKDSLVAFAAGARVSLESHNTEAAPFLEKAAKLGPAKISHDPKPSTEFPAIAETDLLFLDTVHTADFVLEELRKFSPHVTRWIALHDTTSFGARGEDGKEGLRFAIKAFVESSSEWFVAKHTDKQHGLTLLSRDPQDRPAKPIRIWPKGHGPGSELKKIMSSFGANPSPSCSCNGMALRMDEWGVAGCEEHFDKIVAEINKNAERWEWNKHLAEVVKGSLKNVLARPTLMAKLALHATDPFPVLVREAIELARAKEEDATEEDAQLADTLDELDKMKAELAAETPAAA